MILSEIEFYRTRNIFLLRPQWHWRITDSYTGNVVAASTESYTNWADMLNNLFRVTGYDFRNRISGVPGRERDYYLSITFNEKAILPRSFVIESGQNLDMAVEEG